MKHFLTRVVLLAFRVSIQGLSVHFKQNTLKKCHENASLGKSSREKLPFPESYLTSEASLKNIPSPWESRLKCKKLRKYHPRLEKDAQTWKFFFPCSFRSVSSGGLYYPWVGLYYLLAICYKLLAIQFSKALDMYFERKKRIFLA